MIKVGKILIDFDSIVSINPAPKWEDDEVAQIVFKGGLIKSYTLKDMGLTYDEFIDKILKTNQQKEDTKLLKIVTFLGNAKNNKA